MEDITSTDRLHRDPLAVVVMAKPAIPGRVKTRLIGPLTPEQAAAAHAAMLACVLERVERHVRGRRVLALADRGVAGSWFSLRSEPDLEELSSTWQVVGQGEGDLGERLERVWGTISEGDGAVAFLGVDSPDVPAAALRAIGPALASHDAAIGPVSDGGYWTLAARGAAPALLRGIDWGTPAVYDQTRAAARRAGLSVSMLPGWHDVDEPDDLRDLRQRLATAEEPPLMRLRERLRAICENQP